MEILDILDENGNYTGKTQERKLVHEQGLWHIHVGVWLMNKKGELLFQKRAATKINPNKWTRTGGHVDSGETPLQAIQRETQEEIGVKIPLEKFELLGIEKDESASTNKVNRQFIYSYFAFVDYKLEDYTMQKEEVSDLKYMTLEEMKKAKENNDNNYTFINWQKCDEVISTLDKKRNSIINKKEVNI